MFFLSLSARQGSKNCIENLIEVFTDVLCHEPLYEVAGCTCFPALETARIDVIASAKEAAEQADLG
jgi:hypothetical protein